MNNKNNLNLTHQLTYELGCAIVQGKYNQEKPLPSEAEICEQFEVSRSATREAVKMLSAKGLVSSRPRIGIRIEAQENWNLFDTDVLEWILSSGPTIQTLQHLIELRNAIEPEAAALAAANRGEKELAALEDALERMKAAESGLGDELSADIDFHTSLLAASGNPFFNKLKDFIATALKVSIRFTNQLKGVQAASYEDHKAIYEAIKKQRPELARATAQSLQAEALNLIKSHIEDTLPKTGQK